MQSDPAIVEAFDAGRRAWPGTALTIDRFARHAASAGVSRENLARRPGDLFLAAACADGDRQAIRSLEGGLLSHVESYVARFGLGPHALDEVRQKIRLKILVGNPPGIARYRGVGPLAAWVRVTAVRVAVDVAEAATSTQLADVDIELLELGLGSTLSTSPERNAALNLYRDRLRAALEQSLHLLDARDKTLLRLYAIDGLNLAGIATLYRVHRATVGRWFLAIRTRIWASVRKTLDLRATPSPSEMGSLISLFQDEIHLSAGSILGSSNRSGNDGEP